MGAEGYIIVELADSRDAILHFRDVSLSGEIQRLNYIS